MRRSKESTIAITGASRGIGRAAMRAFGRAGYDVLGVARSDGALATLSKELAAEGIDASYRVCDLSDLEAVAALAEELGGHPSLRGLVLNAGVASNRRLVESQLSERLHEMTVNYLAPAHLLSQLVPRLEARKGFVVAVGSLTSLLPFPTNTNYAASKAALAHMIRSLRLEVSSALHLGLVLPGLVRTAMAAGYRAPDLLASTPEEVAAAMVQCVEKRERVVIPGLQNQLLVTADRFSPRLVDELLRLGIRPT